jgi:hypothetical protein
MGLGMEIGLCLRGLERELGLEQERGLFLLGLGP